MEKEMVTIPKQRYVELILIEQKLKQAEDFLKEEMKIWEKSSAEDNSKFFEKYNL